MKNFAFEELLLLSRPERRARRIVFDETATILRSVDNGTGKSSIIKSLFWTLGADPVKESPRWKAASIRSLLRLKIGGVRFYILRTGDRFAVYDSNKECLGTFQRITSELAPFLSNVFGFNLKLPDRNGQFRNLAPAYMLLPFYMDQDGSWQDPWTAFERLQAVANWKKAVVEYHAEIRGHQYYEAQAAKMRAEKQAKEFDLKHEGLNAVFGDLGKRFEAAQFNVSYTEFQSELEELLALCSRLREREEQFKVESSELRAREDALSAQIAIAEHAREELAKDQQFALQADDAVLCPTCGAHYENSFQERFLAAADEDTCRELALTLRSDREAVQAKLAAIRKKAERTREELSTIERLLAKKEGEIQLRDLIRQEGRQELRQAMRSHLAVLEENAGEARATAAVHDQKMRKLDSRKRRQEVNDYYCSVMQEFREALELPSVQDDEIRALDRPPAARGSEGPRLLVAYKVAYLHVMHKFGMCKSFPLVVDSPNQQDQDRQNLRKVMAFFASHLPKGTQLILGGVRTEDVKLPGRTIRLTKKGQVLSESEFEAVESEFAPFLDEMSCARQIRD